MSYQLGIDFGTTFLAAAVRRADRSVEPVALGGAPVVPAALHLARDGRVTVGDGALRLAGIDPGRVVRAVKRSVGDPAPIVAGGREWTAEDLAAQLVRWVVDRVAEREDGPAAGVVLAHPASWTGSALERFAAALDDRGVGVTFLTEPQAVALAHVAAGGELGDTVAVHDLGGGRCETAVLRRDAGWPGFVVLGRPEGVADVGGLDLDDVLIEHVCAVVAGDLAADARTRRACTRAKESLSSKAEVVVRLRQGELREEVRLERATLEDLIASRIARTVAALRRTIASAGLGDGVPATVLLAGGSSRIPLVGRMLADELGLSIVTADEPELLVARGAALAGVPTVGSAGTGNGARIVLSATPEPVVREPVAAEPVDADPVSSERVAEPVVAAPAATEPVVAEPVVAEPVVAEPVAAAPVEPEPVALSELVTTEFPVPASTLLEPQVPEPSLPEPEVTEPSATEPEVSGPSEPEPEAAEPEVSEPEVSEPELSAPVPAAALPQRFAPTRPPAVLDVSRRGGRTRSLPQLLVGAGAVVVAALVVVALFRPDGPLDPPTEAVGRDVTVRSTVVPAVPVPPAAVPGSVRAEAVPALRPTAPPRLARPPADDAVDLPVDVRTDPARSAVDTTPPAAARVRPAGNPPAPGVSAPRAVGAAPRVPPTPAAPGV